MNRRLMLALSTVLLTGCQLPLSGSSPQGGMRTAVRDAQDNQSNLPGQPPEGGLRMVVRDAQVDQSKLQGQPTGQLQALKSLTESGYNELGRPINLANATFRLEVADFEADKEEQFKDVLFADYMTALSRAEAAGFTNVLPSANLIDGITKQVNDGIYARLELILEAKRKAELRRQLYAAFREAAASRPDDPDWQVLLARLAASLQLAGESPEVPAGLQDRLDTAKAAFTGDLLLSKPLGFYTLSPELERIFQADRMLQTRMALVDNGRPDDEALRVAALATSVLAGHPKLKSAYDEVAHFYERMTNPFSAFSPSALIALKPADATWDDLATSPERRKAWFGNLSQVNQEGMSLAFSMLPPSISVETSLLASDPPPDNDLMGHLIRRVREGKVSLAPRPDSGFYQYQQHALEALLTPEKNAEGTKVQFGEKYLKRLEEAFKTGLTKARETHAKQLAPGIVSTSISAPALVPRLFVEPLPTVYLRYGDMYAFLEREVLPLFSAEDLAARPLREDGAGAASLKDEVASTKRLMYGLYLVGAANLGLAVPADFPLDQAARAVALAEAKTWLATYHQDSRLAADTRVSIPVSVSESSPDHKVIHFWGTAGVTLVKVNFGWQPEEGTTKAPYFVMADKFITFERPYEKGVLNRTEYRRILDTSKTLSEAQRKLGE